MRPKRSRKDNILLNRRKENCDWLAVCSIGLVTLLLILKQPIGVEGEETLEEENDILSCCNSTNCGLNRSDCNDIPEISEWNCEQRLNARTILSLLDSYGIVYPKVAISWPNSGQMLLKARRSPSSRAICYSMPNSEKTIPEVCSSLKKKSLHATLIQQGSASDSVCKYSSLVVNTMESYNREDLKIPDKWASYLIISYGSTNPSINVTFHQADDIADSTAKENQREMYNIELLRRSHPGNHSPWEMYERRSLDHIPGRGHERTILFRNVSTGVFYVRLQLEKGCFDYCPYMRSNEITITDAQTEERKQEDHTIPENEATTARSVTNTGEVAAVKIASLVTGCSVFIISLLLVLMLKGGLVAKCKAMARPNYSKPDVPREPPDVPDQPEPHRRKVFVVFTLEGTSPEGSSPHEEVFRNFVNLLIGQLQMDVRTVDLCIGDIRRLKPRKWVHRQLEICDIVVIINSESAMEHVKRIYFQNPDEMHADLKIVDRVFDIAIEGIMARLQSGQIRDCPSRYAVVTFPHSISVENFIPYLSTEMNYRLLSDWHDFCLHVQGIDVSSPELLQTSYNILCSAEGVKLQNAMESAAAHYSWNQIDSVDKTGSLDPDLSQGPNTNILTSPNYSDIPGGVTIDDQLLPSNPLDSGFQSHDSQDQTILDLRANFPEAREEDCQQCGNINNSELPEASQPLMIRHNHPDIDSIDFIPPTLLPWSSSETISTTLSGSQSHLYVALRRINDMPLNGYADAFS